MIKLHIFTFACLFILFTGERSAPHDLCDRHSDHTIVKSQALVCGWHIQGHQGALHPDVEYPCLRQAGWTDEAGATPVLPDVGSKEGLQKGNNKTE